MYHALGDQQDPNNPRSQPAAPQFQPQAAPGPAGYQQGAQYGQQGPYPGNPQGYPSQEQGWVQQQDPNAGGLVQQMGGMGLGQEAPSRPGKKKHRHAYHNLEAPAGSSQAYNGLPQGEMAGNPQFLNQQQSQLQNPYAGQNITPAMNQFPAPSGGAFVPGNQMGQAAVGASMTVSSGPGTNSAGRVDPEQVPSIPRARDAAAQYYLQRYYQTMDQHLPPPAAIPYMAYDQGNSSPKFARLTLNTIPAAQEALSALALPLGLVLQPLAPLQLGEEPIPVLDFGESGPPRCRRCRTYINPFMTFQMGGNKFACNMCTFPNDVPPEYFAPTDPSGVRVDRDQRPELRLGTVEFMVPKEYWAKEPVGLRWLFLIDVGQEAINRGFLEAFCDGVLAALYGDIPEEESEDAETRRAIPRGSKVGFVTFDKEIHFYNCNASLTHPQMLVMPDIEDPFVPLGSEGLFVDPYEARATVTSLLTQLPKLFADIKNPEPALLPTLNAALGALSETGGKIICSLSALPTWGPGRLFMRDDSKLHGIESEKKLFQTEHASWKKCANDMVKSGIGVDFFIAAPGGVYMDIATIGKLMLSYSHIKEAI
jgi:protein transport protein SEC24